MAEQLTLSSPAPSVAPAGSLAAGGTLPRPHAVASPSLARRVRLAAEVALFFVAAPLLLRYAVFELRLPLFLLLPPLFIGFIVYLLWDRTFSVWRELKRGFSFAQLGSMLAIFLVAGGCVAAFIAQEMPRQFLSFPRQRPELWMVIVLLYPWLSVVAQELVYRTFFFHRYGPLFGARRGLAVVVNGCLFGFGHLVVNNWVAVASTTVMGVLFAYRYARTGSFSAVWFEHTIWGWLVFTVGLGGYFFTGVANPKW